MSEEALAVKTISLRKGSLRELSILQSLDHPNIVKLLLYHKSDKELHLLCQKMAITLYDKLDHEGAFDLEETLPLALQLFRALQYLEEELVLHRDIEPTNILLNETLRHLKLCDLDALKDWITRVVEITIPTCVRAFIVPLNYYLDFKITTTKWIYGVPDAL